MSAKGRLQPVALMMSDRLLLGVKQTVSAYILVLDDSLQCAQAVWKLKVNLKSGETNLINEQFHYITPYFILFYEQ